MRKPIILIIMAILWLPTSSINCKIYKQNTFKPKLPYDYFFYPCDSLVKPDNSYYISMLEKYAGRKLVKDIDSKPYHNMPFNKVLNTLGKKYKILEYVYVVDDYDFITGMYIDIFLSDKYALEVMICLKSKVKSCCGIGGEFASRNNEKPYKEKNDKIVENLQCFKIFQFKKTLDSRILSPEGEQRLKQYLKEYRAKKYKKTTPKIK